MALPSFMGGDDLTRKLDDILKLLKGKEIGVDGSQKGLLPSNLEKVADAGGWDESTLEHAKAFMYESAKIKKSQWMSMNENLIILKDIGAAGNLEILTSLPDRIMDTINLKVDELFAPLQNEINQLIANAMQPIIDLLNPAINNLTAMVGDNAIGGTVGALSGMVLGAFVGSPVLGAFIGGIVGASLEQFQKDHPNPVPGVVPEPYILTKPGEWDRWGNDIRLWWDSVWRNLGWR